MEIDLTLAEALPAGSLFAVGGRVRDEVRASIDPSVAPSKDLDYVVSGIELADLGERLARVGRVDLVGVSFSVFKVTVRGVTVDVALPRRETSLGVGHRDFSIVSGPAVSLEADLARRDFRMNMIARAIPEGRLVDPFEGVADIRSARIDILTARAFEEDSLRMLRAAQFAARFRYQTTVSTRAAMRRAAPLVASVSAERVAEEFTKLFLLSAHPSIGLELLRETGVLAAIWPELLEGVGVEQNEFHAFDVYRHALETLDAAAPGDLMLRLAALLHDIGKPRTKEGPHFYRHEQLGADIAREMLGRLHFSREISQGVEQLVRHHMYSADAQLSDAALRRFITRIGVNNLDRQFALRAADIAGSGLPKRDDANERFEQRVREELSRKPPFSVADLRIGGEDVIGSMVRKGLAEKGFRGDRRVGEALAHLFEQVTEDPQRNDPETLQVLLDSYLERER